MARQPMFGMLAIFMILGGAVLLVKVRAQATRQAQIVFTSHRDGNAEIYVMDADGKNQRNLTNDSENAGISDWFDPAFVSVSSAGKLKGTWGWLKQER